MNDKDFKLSVEHEDLRSKSNVSLLSSRSCKDNGSYIRRNLTKFSREELEDKLFNVLEDQLELKKQAASQTDVIRRMSTKVNRLVSERKRLTKGFDSNLSAKELETDDKIEDQCFRILELEKKNKKLHESLKVIKHQLSNQRPGQNYSWVKSKVNSRPQSHSVSKSKVSVKPQLLSISHDGGSRKDSRLQDAKPQHFISEQSLDDQNIDLSKEEFNVRENEYLSTIVKLEERIKHYQEQAFSQDLEINRLKNEFCGHVSKMASVEAEKANLEENLSLVQQQHKLLIDEIDKLTSQLREERNKNLSLQKYVDEVDNLNMVHKELEDKITDLKKENEVLSCTNHQLASKTFDFHENCSSQTIVDGLLEEKKRLVDNIEDSFDKITKLELKISACERDKELLHNKISDLQTDLFNHERKKSCEMCESYRSITVAPSNLSFLNNYEAGLGDNEKQLESLQKQYLELNEELNKTKSLLEIQKQINLDSSAQLDQWKKKLKTSEQEHVKNIKDLNDVVKNRTDKILALEQQIRSLAVDNIKLNRHHEVENVTGKCEGVFEFEVSHMALLSEELTEDYFLTVHFHNFPVHYSAFISPSKLDPFLKIVYHLQLSESVEHFLKTDFLRVELHKFVEDCRDKYATIGTSVIALKEVLKYPGTRLHGTCNLVEKDGITAGEMSYMISMLSGQKSASGMPGNIDPSKLTLQVYAESNAQPKPRARRRSKWFSDLQEFEGNDAMPSPSVLSFPSGWLSTFQLFEPSYCVLLRYISCQTRF